MLNALKNEANQTLTANGALTYKSSTDACLDFFATVGALRHSEDEDIVRRFVRAYAEDKDLAVKTLFFARDVRGGLGERRVFRTILEWMANNRQSSVQKNVGLIAEYGRFDDLLCLLGTPCEQEAMAVIKEQLAKDRAALEAGEAVSLLGKWLPSCNASSRKTVAMAKRIARNLGMEQVEYRKLLVALRKRSEILENALRARDYSFDYAKQPSKAMLKYRKAFMRNDGERYGAYMERVIKGEASLHTQTLAPYDIIAPIVESSMCYKALSEQERCVLDATWKAQEDYTQGENALVVIDGSGSMYGWSKPTPAAVALSLGIYYGERNQGAFKDHFITFSENPQLVHIQGADIVEKVQYCKSFNECANTNISKVFALILNAAVKNGMPQEELPARLYIISDMEFDSCAKGAKMTNFEQAKKLYAEHGYRLPEVIFWNVNSWNEQQPVTKNEQGVALISGNSPRIFGMIKQGNLSPMACMLEILQSERYAAVSA